MNKPPPAAVRGVSSLENAAYFTALPCALSNMRLLIR